MTSVKEEKEKRKTKSKKRGIEILGRGRNWIDRKARDSIAENVALSKDVKAMRQLALCLSGEAPF